MTDANRRVRLSPAQIRWIWEGEDSDDIAETNVTDMIDVVVTFDGETVEVHVEYNDVDQGGITFDVTPPTDGEPEDWYYQFDRRY